MASLFTLPANWIFPVSLTTSRSELSESFSAGFEGHKRYRQRVMASFPTTLWRQEERPVSCAKAQDGELPATPPCFQLGQTGEVRAECTILSDPHAIRSMHPDIWETHVCAGRVTCRGY